MIVERAWLSAPSKVWYFKRKGCMLGAFTELFVACFSHLCSSALFHLLVWAIAEWWKWIRWCSSEQLLALLSLFSLTSCHKWCFLIQKSLENGVISVARCMFYVIQILNSGGWYFSVISWKQLKFIRFEEDITLLVISARKRALLI